MIEMLWRMEYFTAICIVSNAEIFSGKPPLGEIQRFAVAQESF